MTETQLEVPSNYQGQPVCARCANDPDGRRWPICIDIVSAEGSRHEAHTITCQRYWGKGQHWVCDSCKEEPLHA